MRTLLIVDDEPNVLAALTRALHEEPYRILTAGSAVEAAHVVDAEPVDLVICDQMMPVMTGTEFLSWLAVRHPEVIRILLTGCPTTETALSAINEGRIYHFFVKPCDPADLTATIRHALEQKNLVENTRKLLAEIEEVFQKGLDLLGAARLHFEARSDEPGHPADRPPMPEVSPSGPDPALAGPPAGPPGSAGNLEPEGGSRSRRQAVVTDDIG